MVLRMTSSRRHNLGVSPWPCAESKKKTGPRRDPPPKALSDYLPKELARQKTTSNQQHTSTKRYRAGNRNATRGWERRSAGTSRSGSGRRSSRRSRRSRSLSHRNRSRRSSVDIDVTTGSYALEASEHLVLADTQLLGNGAEVIRISILVLPDRSLALVAVHVLDATSDRRLGEGRGSSRQHHSQHRRQQHYFPQLITSLSEDYLHDAFFHLQTLMSTPFTVFFTIFLKFLNNISLYARWGSLAGLSRGCSCGATNVRAFSQAGGSRVAAKEL